MKLIKVASASLNQTPLDWDGNLANILAAIDTARQDNATLLCLPELCITGYGCDDMFLAPHVQNIALQLLQEISQHTAGMIVALGLPVLYQGSLFNTAALVVDQQTVGFAAKRHLAGDGIHYEPRWFRPWPAGDVGEIEASGKKYPLGDLLFDVGGIRIGFEICEDAWVANRVGLSLAERGVDILLNPSASHFAFGKQQIRRRFVLEGSRAYTASYVFANMLGNEAGRAIYDGDRLIASEGKILVEGDRFSFADYRIETAVIDVEATRLDRSAVYVLPSDKKYDHSIVRSAFEYPDIEPMETERQVAAWEASKYLKEEEFTRAVSLALFDYLRKSRSHGFIVSLSGGADSAAVATLCATSVHFAWQELGREGVRQKLSYLSGWQQIHTAEDLLQQMLICAYQATRNSSETTRTAAREVAAALNARFYEFEIDSVVDDYIDIVSGAIGRRLDWNSDDITLQNIQARARAPGVWMLANIENALLLSTSNRSEAAVGYATMDGDTSGGLSPIAGIDKAFLRQWLSWMEQEGPAGGLRKIAALRAINEQVPTAELRPLSSRQTDEDDLMPYDILDWIERGAIRDKRSPLDIYRLAVTKFPHCTGQQLLEYIERFFRLWSRNQWKRERYAPSFHLDDENLDPKTWCRFPILSGGFQRELATLRAVVANNSQD